MLKKNIIFFLPIKIFAKIALIFGITGQDGYYLSKFLIEKGYKVHGVTRKNSTNIKNIININSIMLHNGDMSDSDKIFSIIKKTEPDEIYNLAAQSNVGISFGKPEYTANIDALGTLRILDAILKSGRAQEIKYYQASSSEMFGKIHNTAHTESTPFHPCSPYATSKAFAHWITINYRTAYKIFTCNGILFNHESPLRSEQFVTKKITKFLSRFKNGIDEILYLGNIDSKRDWGFAGDYVEAMWLMLQQPYPDDYIIATGETHSVREFVEEAFSEAGIKIEWKGFGVNEIGINISTGKKIIQISSNLFRPTEIDIIFGDASKAKKILNWTPKTTFRQLVKMMVDADMATIN